MKLLCDIVNGIEAFWRRELVASALREMSSVSAGAAGCGGRAGANCRHQAGISAS